METEQAAGDFVLLNGFFDFRMDGAGHCLGAGLQRRRFRAGRRAISPWFLL
jgi:hypothetical protein